MSAGGGSHPVWSRDGKELFFLDAEGRLSVVDVRGDSGFSTGRPKRILERSYFTAGAGQGQLYDVSRDGERFLMIEESTSSASAPNEIHLVLNWVHELERLMSTVGR